MYEQDEKTPFIILDEATGYGAMLQEIRFLLTFREDWMAPMVLILVGQPS
ncbi:hypothetical protein [Ferroacidibacillus organovorans]|nr:hypothetical protein [Ferroacidibacillus organovorans]